MTDPGPHKRPLSDCIIGSRVGKNGYARLPSGRRGIYFYAHRVAYQEAYGPIPEGFHVHHDCGNKACVNPEHMRALAPRDHHRLSGDRCGHHDRGMKKDGRSYCRVCERERKSHWYWEQGGREWHKGYRDDRSRATP
jgi:HNH endonuclease